MRRTLKGYEVRVLTGDRDCFQLVDDQVDVVFQVNEANQHLITDHHTNTACLQFADLGARIFLRQIGALFYRQTEGFLEIGQLRHRFLISDQADLFTDAARSG